MTVTDNPQAFFFMHSAALSKYLVCILMDSSTHLHGPEHFAQCILFGLEHCTPWNHRQNFVFHCTEGYHVTVVW